LFFRPAAHGGQHLKIRQGHGFLQRGRLFFYVFGIDYPYCLKRFRGVKNRKQEELWK
jgi:hypothetical protein